MSRTWEDEKDEEQDSRRQPCLRRHGTRRDGDNRTWAAQAVHYSKVVVLASALHDAVNAHHLQGTHGRPIAIRRSLRAVVPRLLDDTARVLSF